MTGQSRIANIFGSLARGAGYSRIRPPRPRDATERAQASPQLVLHDMKCPSKTRPRSASRLGQGFQRRLPIANARELQQQTEIPGKPCERARRHLVERVGDDAVHRPRCLRQDAGAGGRGKDAHDSPIVATSFASGEALEFELPDEVARGRQVNRKRPRERRNGDPGALAQFGQRPKLGAADAAARLDPLKMLLRDTKQLAKLTEDRQGGWRRGSGTRRRLRGRLGNPRLSSGGVTARR